jgi:septal ring factor EnvC (AmiA/AmiB activator)
MQTLIAAPEPLPDRKQLKRFRKDVAAMEKRVTRARQSEPDTPGVRAALDSAARKLAKAKEDLAEMETTLKTLGKAR